jgi:hypothetical protein
MSDQIPRNTRADDNQEWVAYETAVREFARVGVSRDELDRFLEVNDYAPLPPIKAEAFAEIEMLMAKDRAIARVNSQLSQMWRRNA